MSRRKAADYKSIFLINEMLDGTGAVKEMMSDFERATWRLIQECSLSPNFLDVPSIGPKRSLRG